MSKGKGGKPIAASSREAQVVHGADRQYKRIIKTFIKGDREYQYHATKGWRSYRAAASGGN